MPTKAKSKTKKKAGKRVTPQRVAARKPTKRKPRTSPVQIQAAPEPDFTLFEDMVNPGSQFLAGIRAVQYVNENGESAMAWRIEGSSDRVMVAGLLENVKLSFIALSGLYNQ